jgi:serine/threonine protein kinase
MIDPTRIDRGSNTRLDDADSGTSGGTRIDQQPSAAPRNATSSLPSELAKQYGLVSAFDSQGAEADLYLIERLADKSQFVLKLYRRGMQPKSEVMESIGRCDRKHVVELIAWGTDESVWYEILEFAAHGTLRNIFRKGAVSPRQMLAVLRELSGAIEHIHSQKIVHRDLKPENVLVRSAAPLDLVLTDFGIASISDATEHRRRPPARVATQAIIGRWA